MQKTYNSNRSVVSGAGTYFSGTTTGEPEYEEEYTVASKVRQHSEKGYYYCINVSETDDVFFQVYKGGKIAYLLHKFLDRPALSVGGNTWNSVRKRTHLPATIGATYLEIDAAIISHKETENHDNYAEGILAAPPAGLKMIEGLEKLAEGDPDGSPHGTTLPADPNFGLHHGNYVYNSSDCFYMSDCHPTMLDCVTEEYHADTE